MNQKTIAPLLFPPKKAGDRKQLQNWIKNGQVYKAGPRLYASVSRSNLEKTIRENWFHIVAALFPDTLLSYRSALEFSPTSNGMIHLTGRTNRAIHYPGLTLVFHRGPKAFHSDSDFMEFKCSSIERAILENLSITKKDSHHSAVDISVIEQRLEQILDSQGEKELNRIRDAAKKIAQKNEQWKFESEKLNQMIGALLGTKESAILRSRKAISRAMGKPYDSSCIARLESLFAQLKQSYFKTKEDAGKGSEHFENKAFFESYFSNYIEGTTFELSEAEEIIFDKKIPPKRPKDAHDVAGTFALVSNPNEMLKTPNHVDDLITLLKSRHHTMMAYRPEADPGQFKEKPNRAGETQFIAPGHVMGTLEQGFHFYRELTHGFAKAVYMMFFIAEVHPFTDGNGRIARIMMNVELAAAHSPTIIIPNVYRDDYLLALRALSRKGRTEPIIKMLGQAHDFSNLDFSDYQHVLRIIRARNWFKEPDDAKIILSPE